MSFLKAGLSAAEEFWTIDPATEGRLESYAIMDPGFALSHAQGAARAFEGWRDTGFPDRAALMMSLAKSLRANRERLARMMTHEMGKPIKQSHSEVDKCAWTAEVVAERGEKWLDREVIETDSESSFVRFEPLGTILGVMPWNFPAWQAIRFAVPAIMAGNVALLRHSNVVPGTALLLEQVFAQAGFPDHVFKALITSHDTVELLIASEWVKGVSFTGSAEVGCEVAASAAKHAKKTVLELGGSDPFIVLKDADLDRAAEAAAESRLINSGQSCINAKRFIVEEEVYEEFREKFVNEVASYIVGDPLDPMTDVGPLVREAQLDEAVSLVRDAVRKGAKVLHGGRRMAGKGYFFEPTVLDEVNRKMKVATQEVFAPIAPLIKVKGEDEAVEWANGTKFGLGAAVWTRDPAKASAVVRRLEAGLVFVNGEVKSDPRMPFGGVKGSGYGRELSKFGIREFTNVKGVNFYKF